MPKKYTCILLLTVFLLSSLLISNVYGDWEIDDEWAIGEKWKIAGTEEEDPHVDGGWEIGDEWAIGDNWKIAGTEELLTL